MSRLFITAAVISLPLMGCILTFEFSLNAALAESSSAVLLAQKADRFPPNPLTTEIDDPLPQVSRAALLLQMAELNQQALMRLQAENADAAFDLWNQELRLSRRLGPVEETKALARVGQIAWGRNNNQQVGYIGQRLQQIQTAALQGTPSATLLTELAIAYQVIRDPERALQVYDRQLEIARQRRDATAEFQMLNQIAQTHLDWFGYVKAAKVYEDLLSQAREQNNPQNQLAYAYQLAYIYEQAKQPQAAIAALETLVELYAQTPEPLLLANFQVRLADQYRLTQQMQLAEVTYQAAYRTGEAQQQWGFAGDALRRLATFYRQQQRLDAAIQVYEFLTAFEQEIGLNPYNAMDAYDHLGQIFVEQASRENAIAAFQQGLQLAQGLEYRVEYFRDQIAKVTAPPSESVTPTE